MKMMKSHMKEMSKGGLKGPSNLGMIKSGRSGRKMSKPSRMKSRAPKSGGRY